MTTSNKRAPLWLRGALVVVAITSILSGMMMLLGFFDIVTFEGTLPWQS